MAEDDYEPGTVIAKLTVSATGAAFDADGTPLDADGNRVTTEGDTE